MSAFNPNTVATPALDWISVAGFRSIASIKKLELRPINVLIGPNGSGKSNLIGVFSFLAALRDGRLQEYVRRHGGADKLLYFGSKITEAIELRVAFNSEVDHYHVVLRANADDSLYVSKEFAGFWGNKAKYSEPYDETPPAIAGGLEAGISSPNLTGVPAKVRNKGLERWRVYHVHDTSFGSPLRKTARVDDNAFLRVEGANLPAFLYLLQSRHSNSYQLIRRTVQSVAPFFDDFVLAPDRLDPSSIKLAWRHKSSDLYFGASSLSDGTLRFIMLATLFLQPLDLRPSVIVVDEPELGLHPAAITLLASLVRQASVSSQVILATQSPVLLDHFEPQDVIVAERVSEATVVRRLDPAPLEEWLEDYSLGQLWEKNEIGGRPGSE